MARREDYEHWGMGLPIESEALQDLDMVCEELGLQRGEVCRLIIITWSKARRGHVQQLWGFTPGVIFASSFNGQSGASGTAAHDAAQDAVPSPSSRRKNVVSETAAAAVQGLTLDPDY
jgi:hypothetical protein